MIWLWGIWGKLGLFYIGAMGIDGLGSIKPLASVYSY
jgi:hypothetical protein